jgi:hypothetical protein
MAGRTGSQDRGKVEKADGGYRVTALKVFASGVPGGDVFMTSAILKRSRPREPIKP